MKFVLGIKNLKNSRTFRVTLHGDPAILTIKYDKYIDRYSFVTDFNGIKDPYGDTLIGNGGVYNYGYLTVKGDESLPFTKKNVDSGAVLLVSSDGVAQ